MAGRPTMTEQSPPPEFVPMPRFRRSAGHSSRGGLDDAIMVSISPTAAIPALQNSFDHSRPGGSHEMINVSSSSTAAVPAIRSSPTLPRGFLAALHWQGRCLPCRYRRQAGGCRKGASCNYCHHPHDEMSLARIQKLFRRHIGQYSDLHGLHPNQR
eukprot:TRINITY_DN37796_c0_g1_i1.p1 TRINITY_DN37796_c0_g1~~TRINITY_DN37796_c0_g1_i1.p1  ORF type:complete len:173 (-),score=9.80 TRINITY_DN37796_c0_g1_i1:364-831(-)